jgi:hypothetical protein
MFTQIVKPLLRGLRFVLGWPEIHIPNENFVSVVVHTSYFDVFIIGLYCMEFNVVMALNPKIYALWPSFFSFLHFIPSKPLEERGTGGVSSLCSQIKEKSKDRKTIFFISPKGTIKKNEWRSGYKYIAMTLDWPLRSGLLDYSKRTFCFGPAHLHDELNLQEKLQNELKDNCPLNPKNCEFCINVDYDPYELLSIPDLVCVTNVCLIPAILKAFYVREYILGFISISSFIASWAYHSSRESSGAELDRNLSSITILWGLSRMKKMTALFVLNSFSALIFYLLGVPRQPGLRGPYAVYHSLFHVFIGLASWHALKF